MGGSSVAPFMARDGEGDCGIGLNVSGASRVEVRGAKLRGADRGPGNCCDDREEGAGNGEVAMM